VTSGRLTRGWQRRPVCHCAGVPVRGRARPSKQVATMKSITCSSLNSPLARRKSKLGSHERAHAAGRALGQRPAQQRLEPAPRRVLRRLREQARFDAPQQPCHRRGSQLFLGLEMLVQAALGDADGGGQLVHRHQLEAALREQLVGGVEDGLFAQLELAVAKRPHGAGGALGGQRGGGGHGSEQPSRCTRMNQRAPRF